MHLIIRRFVVTIALLFALTAVHFAQAETSLVPSGATWKYLVTAGAPAATWTTVGFDDTSWPSGPAELGYGDGDEATVIGFGPDTNNKYPTTYFRKTFNVADPSIFGSLIMTLNYDDGAIVYINGTEVYRINLPAGAVSYSTFATAASEYTPISFTVPASVLVAGNNVVAVEMHQGNATSTDLSMSLSISANQSPSVSIATPGAGQSFYVPVGINLTVNASDPDGTVARVDYYYQGGNPIGASLTAPFSFTWTNATEGSYALTAVATDNTGGTGTSAPVNITVIDTNPPVLVNAIGTSNSVIVTYSKRVSAVTGTNASNYAVNNGVNVLGASYGAASNIIVIATTTITDGIDYTLTVNNVQDLNGHTILPNSQIVFRRAAFIPADVGNPSIAGSVSATPGGAVVVTGAGSNIGGTGDQFTYAYQQVSGNFDYKVRVSSLDVTDPSAKASLMARETLASNSVFAASVASPVALGCYFQSRATSGAAAVTTGAFPASYPTTWLRLRRTNNVATGFASADGITWVQLGSVTLSATTVYIGFGVTSHDVAHATRAEYHDYATVGAEATVVSQVDFANEPLAACSRTGPLVISEIMYKPVGTNNSNLEYIEIYNSNPFYEEVSGYRISGDIDYTFPPRTFIPGGALIVVAKDPAAVQNYYGITGVYGPYSNSLPREGTIRLRTEVNAILLEINYSDDNPWPAGTSGTGHSLVLARPSYGEKDPHAWEPSAFKGGSPGAHEPLRPKTGLNAVVINEFLAHTDDPLVDYIELYNHSSSPVDISGCWLSDDPSTNIFHIPAGTILPPGGFVSFNAATNTIGFALKASGETIYFLSPDGNRILDAVQFGAQQNGVATGRYPDGAPEFYRLTSRTPGTNNAAILIDDVVINEIMYGPLSEEVDDQYVELYNQGTNTISLKDWKFTGIDFKFPAGATLPPHGYVVVGKNRSRLLAHYPQLNANNLFGDFGGKLSRSGERVAIAKPD